MKLNIDSVKKIVEELRHVPPKKFCNQKAARKRWLVTAEDREIYEKQVRDKLLADFEKERETKKGR